VAVNGHVPYLSIWRRCHSVQDGREGRDSLAEEKRRDTGDGDGTGCEVDDLVPGACHCLLATYPMLMGILSKILCY
jgi:hypothetical protein